MNKKETMGIQLLDGLAPDDMASRKRCSNCLELGKIHLDEFGDTIGDPEVEIYEPANRPNHIREPLNLTEESV